ncbi:5595_t:CDS:2, partial [Paraglomus occultum]
MDNIHLVLCHSTGILLPVNMIRDVIIPWMQQTKANSGRSGQGGVNEAIQGVITSQRKSTSSGVLMGEVK